MESISIINLNEFQTPKSLDGFYVNSLKEHIRENKSLITKPHKHNSFLYILFTKGFGKHEIDFSIYDVKPGNCFMIAPGQTHHWTLSDDCDGFIFTHTSDFYDLYFSHNRIRQFPFFQSVQNEPMVVFSENESNEIISLMKQLLAEYKSESLFRLPKIMAFTDLVYIETSRVYLSKRNSDTFSSTLYFQKFRQLEDLVDTYFLIQKSAAFYADKMNVSAKHLNRIVKTISGKTTSDIIIDRTLLESKRKIIHAKQSLTQIAEELGFTDYAYFSRLFKNKTGQSPSDFQKSYQSL